MDADFQVGGLCSRRGMLVTIGAAAAGLVGTRAWAQAGGGAQVLGQPSWDTAAWLHRIHDAAESQNYQGTVVVSVGGVVTSARLAHLVDGRQHIERLDAMDGVARHVVRHRDLVHTVWPQRRALSIEQRDQVSSFPGLLHGAPSTLGQFYDLKVESSDERLAGRDVHVLRVRPRDALRYGYRLWVDRQTALMLRMDILGERGLVLESSAFSEVLVGPKLAAESLLEPLRKSQGYQITRITVQRVSLGEAGWRLKSPVQGFGELTCLRRDASLSSVQVVFSDGLAYVTAFIEPYQAERHAREVVTTIGATQTVTRREGDRWLTLMGDVPAATLKAFSEGLARHA